METFIEMWPTLVWVFAAIIAILSPFIIFIPNFKVSEFLSKIQQINLETNSNFVISIVDDNDASYTTEFIRFNKLTPGEIQESLNLNSIYNKTEGNLKFQLRLACGLGEINE